MALFGRYFVKIHTLGLVSSALDFYLYTALSGALFWQVLVRMNWARHAFDTEPMSFILSEISESQILLVSNLNESQI